MYLKTWTISNGKQDFFPKNLVVFLCPNEPLQWAQIKECMANIDGVVIKIRRGTRMFKEKVSNTTDTLTSRNIIYCHPCIKQAICTPVICYRGVNGWTIIGFQKKAIEKHWILKNCLFFFRITKSNVNIKKWTTKNKIFLIKSLIFCIYLG